MRSNLALKEVQSLTVVETSAEKFASAEVFDFNQLQAIQIATQAEAACRLSANAGGCDYEEFLGQYGIVSDFV